MDAEQMDQMVLVVDVANGLTRLGAFAGDELVCSRGVSTARHLTADEAALHVSDFLGRRARGHVLAGAVLSSVVPSHTDAWARALLDAVGSWPLVMGPGLRTGLRMRLENPADVGSDRVANALAAREAYGAPVVAVSLGTTTNLEVVDGAGTYLGGAIAPGVMMGARALSEGAARLPLVELRAPASVIGRGTSEAIRAGVVLGEAARVDGLLDAVAQELGLEASVVVTGHHAAAIVPLLRHEVALDEDLTLRGLALVWRANQRSSSC